MKIADFIIKPLEFIRKHLLALVFLLVLFLIFSPKNETAIDDANLARIDLYGPILESDTFLEKLESLESNPNLKGILLVIDSPGGAISPSFEISETIKRLKEKMPVVAYAQGVMASGSYLAGVSANSIVANTGSMIGSIGVILNGFDVSELAQKLGIKTQGVKGGIYKEAGTYMRAWNKDEKDMLEGLVKEYYELFVQTIIEQRGLNSDGSDFAEGRILSSNSALKLGLIDKIGTIYDAKMILAQKAGVKEQKWLKEQKDEIEIYLEKIFGDKVTKGVQNAIEQVFMQSFKITL